MNESILALNNIAYFSIPAADNILENTKQKFNTHRQVFAKHVFIITFHNERQLTL